MATCNKGFSESYMLLKPEELGFKDLIHILFSSKLDDRKFVDAPDQTEESFEYRCLIFLSIVAQKVLIFVAKPLAAFGSYFEFWLNLVSLNTNFGILLLNFFTGKVIWPEKTSAKFLSFIGNSDKRVMLDSNIKHGDGRYLNAVCMMASKIAYENSAFIQTTVQDHWKMEFLGFFDFWNDYQDKATTQAFMLYDKNEEQDTIIVSFRGTEAFDSDAWCSDFDLSWYQLPGVGKIHGGFMKALGLQKSLGWPKEIEKHKNPRDFAYYEIRKMLRELLSKNEGAKFVVTGHSLGGALAILFPAILALHEDAWLLDRLEGVYTYGQPRVGDRMFGDFMGKKLKDYGVGYFRFVYSNDIVPRLPYDDSALMFKHFGTCVFYNSLYEGQIVKEEPNPNYFSAVGIIVMTINAAWELIRSFTLSFYKGPEYAENLLLRLIRVIGLLVPGASAHFPQDYVNSTRLGSSHLFLSNKKIR